MADLIDRQALMSSKFDCTVMTNADGTEAYLKWVDVANHINSFPAVDAVVLPCKVGDVVWAYFHSWRREDGIVPYQITNLTITQNKKGVWTKKYRAMWLRDGKPVTGRVIFRLRKSEKPRSLLMKKQKRHLTEKGGKNDG